jgi:hypothetical protein
MKQFILFVLVALMFSCGGLIEKKEYRLHVIYSNGQEEILTLEGFGNNYFSLRQGDLKSNGKVIVSGLRSFKVKSVINKGPLTDEDINSNKGCSCNLNVVSTEKLNENEKISQ